MQYLAWRVLVGLHRSITISFMTVGHTKFFPDWCFGLFKRTFRRTAVGCLDDIVGAVVKSAEVNHAQLVAKQNGEVLVPTTIGQMSFNLLQAECLQGNQETPPLPF